MGNDPSPHRPDGGPSGRPGPSSAGADPGASQNPAPLHHPPDDAAIDGAAIDGAAIDDAAIDDAAIDGAAVEAKGLSLKGQRGWVYRDIDLSIPPGALVALAGESGSGRTALLLTLGGRMRPTGGTAMIGGHRLPQEMRAVQRLSALGLIEGVNDLEPALTVGEHISEAMDVQEGLFGPLHRRTRRARIRALLDEAGLPVDPGTEVHDLMPDERKLLGAALALVGRPRLLLLDDIDGGLGLDRQRGLWHRLRDIADKGITVIATCHDAVLTTEVAESAEIVRLPQAGERLERVRTAEAAS